MKKLLAVLLILCMAFCFASCKDKGGNSSSEISKGEGQIGQFNPLSGNYDLDKSAVGQRPIAIMVNNIKVSLPQRGISKADICYETLAEGGITRIMALFPDINKIPDTGSVRSARDYYIDYAVSHNAVFVHFGGSPTALRTIKEKKIDSLNGLYLYPTGFYRDQNRVGKIPIEHTVFTDGEKLLAAAKKKNINLKGETKTAFNFGDVANTIAQGSQAVNITVPFSSSTKATFTYNESTKTYLKGQFGAAQIDDSTGKQLEVKNVFILQTTIQVLTNSDNGARLKVDLNEGNGYYACEGKIVPIKWKKGAMKDMFKYYTLDGKELIVSAGKTWVNVINKNNTISYN